MLPFYAMSALLLSSNLKASTHNVLKTNFTKHFIKNSKFDKANGEVFVQLFALRHKGDYTDLFDFDRSLVEPYFKPVMLLIEEIITEID